MTGFKLDERVRLSIELALTGHSGDLSLLQRQDAEARRLGMIGAEIDVARQGSSFDFRISRAIALALASGNEDRRARRAHATKSGIDGATCVQIESLAAAFMNPASGQLERHDV
jgi:hypothetical protein